MAPLWRSQCRHPSAVLEQQQKQLWFSNHTNHYTVQYCLYTVLANSNIHLIHLVHSIKGSRSATQTVQIGSNTSSTLVLNTRAPLDVSSAPSWSHCTAMIALLDIRKTLKWCMWETPPSSPNNDESSYQEEINNLKQSGAQRTIYC